MVKKRNEGNVNEEGGYQEERPYYDSKSEKEEKEKLPVEYLGYLEKQKESRAVSFIVWSVILFIVFVIAPGKVSWEYNTLTGEIRSIHQFFWGHSTYTGTEVSTSWTDWYRRLDPTPEPPRWLPYDHESLSIFGVIEIPFGVIDHGWQMPDNLFLRMRELESEIRGGRVKDIPRVVSAVNNGDEWNAIIVPICLDEPRAAKNWWMDVRDDLLDWASEDPGTPLPQSYIDQANAYIESFHEPNGNEIPIF